MMLWSNLRPAHILQALRQLGQDRPATGEKPDTTSRRTAEKPAR